MPETPVKNPLLVCFLAMGATVLFAFMNLLVKYTAESGIHVTQIMLFRNLLALPVVLLLVSKHTQSQILLHTKKPLSHFLRGIVGLLSMACFFISFKMLPLGDATALHFAAPIILTVLSIPLLGEKVGKWRWSAVGVGLIGVLIVASPTGNTNFVGSVVALMAAFTSALTAILIRRMGKTEHSLTIVFYFTLTGTAVSFLIAPFFWEPIQTVWVFYALLCIGVLGGCAQYLLTRAYAQAPAAYVSVFSYASIVFSIGFDVVFWAHIPVWTVWVGSAIIVSSGLIILYREVVHKGRSARLTTYSLSPVRPTQADRDAPIPERRSEDIQESANDKQKEEKR